MAERSGIPVLAVRTGADHLAPQAGARMRAAGIPCYPTPARAVRAAAALVQFSTPPPSPLSAPAASPACSPRGPAGRGRRAGDEGAAQCGRHPGARRTGRGLGRRTPRLRVADRRWPGRVQGGRAGPAAQERRRRGGRRRDGRGGGPGLGEGRLPRWRGPRRGDGLRRGRGPGRPWRLAPRDGPDRRRRWRAHRGAPRRRAAGLPVGRDDVEAMVEETRLGALLAGVRGAAPADRGGTGGGGAACLRAEPRLGRRASSSTSTP